MNHMELEYKENEEIERIRNVLLEYMKTHNDDLLREFGDYIFNDLKLLLLHKESLYKMFAEMLYNDLHNHE